MHELPVVCYNTKTAWFTSPSYSGWFFRHHVPEVRHHQENVLRIALEEVKALLLQDNTPAILQGLNRMILSNFSACMRERSQCR